MGYFEQHKKTKPWIINGIRLIWKESWSTQKKAWGWCLWAGLSRDRLRALHKTLWFPDFWRCAWSPLTAWDATSLVLVYRSSCSGTRVSCSLAASTWSPHGGRWGCRHKLVRSRLLFAILEAKMVWRYWGTVSLRAPSLNCRIMKSYIGMFTIECRTPG